MFFKISGPGLHRIVVLGGIRSKAIRYRLDPGENVGLFSLPTGCLPGQAGLRSHEKHSGPSRVQKHTISVLKRLIERADLGRH